jgi:hypothetical protein
LFVKASAPPGAPTTTAEIHFKFVVSCVKLEKRQL